MSTPERDAEEDRRRWDRRHSTAPAQRPSPPIGLDESGVTVPSTGRALDVACGRGGTAVWAATRGMEVVALDISSVAVEATRSLARKNDVEGRVHAQVHDLDEGLPRGIAPFDLVVCQRYRDPVLWPLLVDALLPGGVVVTTVLSVVGARDPGRFHAAVGELESAYSPLDVRIAHVVEADGEATVVAVRPEQSPVDRVAAMDDQLRSVLAELQSTIRRSEADGVITDDEREELRSLVLKLNAMLAEPEEQEGLVDQLEESAIRFEGNHPTVAAVIRSAVDTLTGYGM